MTIKLETRLGLLAQQLHNDEISLDSYLAHLETFFDRENDRVMAFLPEKNRFARLRIEAAELVSRYPEPACRPPLYGVPVGIKDIFHVDGLPTQAGSRLPVDLLTGPQAKTVSQLKQAGALILGKTVTTEFAYFGPGPTRNPHNIDHTPGGSSSGSAAAVAANLCALTLGTQTIGSIVRPAAFCGVIGFKPTSGRISTWGVIPLSPTLDHIGFFTRDLAGAELAASVLCANWQPPASLTRQPVLGVPVGSYLQKTSPAGLEHFNATRQKLAAAGCKIVEVEAMPEFDEMVIWHNELMAGEVAGVHEEWFDHYGIMYHPKTAALIERGHQVPPESITVYQKDRSRIRESLQMLMDEHGLDLWISPPATGPAPAGLGSTGDPIMNLPWTYAGLPALNLPAGSSAEGLPLGLQLTAGWQQDELLLAWAGQIASHL